MQDFFEAILADAQGQPSTMRTASLTAVITGCAMLILASIGLGEVELADEALWLIGLALGGKFIQRFAAEGKPKDKAPAEK